MKVCVALPLCMVMLCACVSAQVEPNTQVPQEVNHAIEAVVASVHAEVDGKRHEPAPEELPHGRSNLFPSAQQSTVLWRAHSDSYSKPPAFRASSFWPETEARGSSAWQTATSTRSASMKNDDSGQGPSHLLNAKPTHSLYSSVAQSVSLRAGVPTIPESNRTPELSHASGHTPLSLTGGENPLQMRDFFAHREQAVRLHRQHKSKSSGPIGLTETHERRRY